MKAGMKRLGRYFLACHPICRSFNFSIGCRTSDYLQRMNMRSGKADPVDPHDEAETQRQPGIEKCYCQDGHIADEADILIAGGLPYLSRSDIAHQYSCFIARSKP